MASSGPRLTTIKSASGATGSVNSAYAGNFQNFINKLEATGYSVRSIGGYNYRNIAGTNTLSNHADGTAIDINPYDNVPGFGGRSAAHNYPSNINELASSSGLSWGGNWNNPDSMHFEVARGSAPVPLDVTAPGYMPNYDPSISKTGAFNQYGDQTFTPNDDGTGGMQFGMDPIGGGTWGKDGKQATDATGADITKADAPGEGDSPLEVTVNKGSQGSTKDVPTAIVTAGNQQSTATANAAKAESEAALKAAQSTNETNQKLQQSSQSWASNWAVRIFLFIVGAIFIAGGLFLFGGQTIFQSKTAGE